MADETPGPKLPSGLSRKFGGLPVWIFVAVILTAIGIVVWQRTRNTDPPADAPTDADATDSDPGVQEQPTFEANPSPLVNTTQQSTFQPDSNSLWAARAITWLTANGATYNEATAAIQKFLGASPLSFSEGALRDKAIAQFGPPPEIPEYAAVQSYHGPATKQGHPPTLHTVKGVSDDTPGELARLYYGSDTPDTRALVAAHNGSKVSPYAPGTPIQIPKFHRPKYFHATHRTHGLYAIAAKNGVSPSLVTNLNPKMVFPVKPGARVRVG